MDLMLEKMAPNATNAKLSLKSSPASCSDKVENLNSNSSEIAKVLFETDVDPFDDEKLAGTIAVSAKPQKRKIELIWRKVMVFSILHLSALYGGWLLVTSAKWATICYVVVLYILSGYGVTAGAHRLWAHRSYKAKWQLRVLLVICDTLAFEGPVYDWVRDHRVHHKYSETDADPHNATRGFFFSHMGWLMCKKHPDVRAKGQNVDISDLKKDPIVMFQKKYYMTLVTLTCFIIPTIIPMIFWNESFVNSWFVATMFRWCVFLHASWLVNSGAHIYGYKSYDKAINPTENLAVSIVTFGEGWHNYHHVFPWDYRASEWHGSAVNLTTYLIDRFAKIGWAYDMKTVSQEVIEKRVKRTGDGSHTIWGWGDKDITKQEQEAILITKRSK